MRQLCALERHQHSHSPVVNSPDNQPLCVMASNGLCTGELGGKVQADPFGRFPCSGKFQDGCVCVRAAEGHASQVGRGINRHVNANENQKKGAFSQQLQEKGGFQKCFLTNAWFCDYTGSFRTERSV